VQDTWQHVQVRTARGEHYCALLVLGLSPHQTSLPPITCALVLCTTYRILLSVHHVSCTNIVGATGGFMGELVCWLQGLAHKPAS
jgi:hypothetical protein